MSQIKSLMLLFPNGVSVDDVQRAVQAAEKVLPCRVSAGGFTPKDPHDTTFSSEDMLYEFGYVKPTPGAKHE